MSNSDGKRSAFAVLLQSAAKAGQKTPPRKKQRVLNPQESSFENCPLCARKFSKSLLAEHVNTCIDAQQDMATERRADRAEGLVGNAKSAQSSFDTKPSPGNRPQEGSSCTDRAESTGRSQEKAHGNAFNRLMQQQRSQARVHNFYLHMLPDRTYKWHWWVTDPHTDARMAAVLLKGPQQSQKRASEFSKGAVNPSVRRVFGGGAMAAKDGSSVVSKSNASASDGIKQPVQPEAASRVQEEGDSPAHRSQDPQKIEPSDLQAGAASHGQQNEGWSGLPPAVWHSLTNLSASKLGGAPKVKIAIRLMTNEPAGNIEDLDWKSQLLQSNAPPKDGRKYQGSNSVLKSALQKNIRLCRPEQAVRCALHLMKEDANELLRRCCVICVEDSVLHPALPLLVWLMAAHTKGYVMTHSQAGRCLAVVYHLAHSPVKDHLIKDLPRKVVSCLELFEDLKGLSPEAAVLVRCLLCRAAYGGMTGDVELLKGFASLWVERFLGHGEQPPGAKSGDPNSNAWHDHIWQVASSSHASLEDPGAVYNVCRVGAMSRADIPPSAVDFHVSSIIEEVVNTSEIAHKAKELKVDAAQYLRTAMWRYRSGLSNKKPLLPHSDPPEDTRTLNLKQLWDTAAPHVERWTQLFLDRRFHHL